MQWIRANASRYELDLQRVAAWGGSAWGYLASILGITADIPEVEDVGTGNPGQPSHIQAVVAWYGWTDFLKRDEQLATNGLTPPEDQLHSGIKSPESLQLGQKITWIPEIVTTANPETYIRPGAPPFFLQHRTKDGVVPMQQSINFVAKLANVLGEDRVRIELIPYAEHADPRFESPDKVRKVLDFQDSYLK